MRAMQESSPGEQSGRAIQELPGAARSWQELPGAARSSQELPGATRSCQELPGVPGEHWERIWSQNVVISFVLEGF